MELLRLLLPEVDVFYVIMLEHKVVAVVHVALWGVWPFLVSVEWVHLLGNKFIVAIFNSKRDRLRAKQYL